MVDYTTLIIAVIGIGVGVALKTIIPFYLKLKRIEEQAEQNGVDPILPKFSNFYLVTAFLGFAIALAPNLAISLTLATVEIPEQYVPIVGGLIFFNAMMVGLGSNGMINDSLKTGNAITFVTGIHKPDSGEPIPTTGSSSGTSGTGTGTQ